MRARCRAGAGDRDHNSGAKHRCQRHRPCWPLEFWTYRALVLEAAIPIEPLQQPLAWIWVLLAVSGVQVQVNHGDDCSFISVRLFVSHVTVALIFEILCKWLNFPSLFSAPEFEFPRNAPPWLLPHRVVARSVDAVTG